MAAAVWADGGRLGAVCGAGVCDPGTWNAADRAAALVVTAQQEVRERSGRDEEQEEGQFTPPAHQGV